MAEGRAAGFLALLTELGRLEVLEVGGVTVDWAVAKAVGVRDGFEGCTVLEAGGVTVDGAVAKGAVAGGGFDGCTVGDCCGNKEE